jgi:hypothetical protein
MFARAEPVYEDMYDVVSAAFGRQKLNVYKIFWSTVSFNSLKYSGNYRPVHY